ncbi:MAG: sulfite exporter TauE/SafE family protein [Rhizobiales bacterium]|nr:sulfite exporter TauE/SafE family protein [Hyphomicrobiales bacterium]
MSAADLLILGLAGLLSGTLHAVAGGGTFFSFGALLAVGLPPITANATSAVAMVPGYVASAIAYRREVRGVWRKAILLGIASAIGSVIGALILIGLDNQTFARFVPWLLLAATLVFALGPFVSRLLPDRPREGAGSRAIGAVVQFTMAIYGGFFGAGMGIMMLASLGLTEGQNFHRINALKHILSIVIQTASIVVFVQGDVISWPEALVLIVAVVAGGWFGVDVARRFPISAVRGFVIATGAALTVYYFLRA